MFEQELQYAQFTNLFMFFGALLTNKRRLFLCIDMCRRITEYDIIQINKAFEIIKKCDSYE